MRGAYRFLSTSGEPVDMTLVDDVWRKQIPLKVSLFVWRLLCNRLLTKDNLVWQHVLHSTDTTCISGCGELETVTHLFLAYDIFNSLWSLVWHWLGITSVSSGDIRQHFVQFTDMLGLPRFTHLFLRVIWFASVWVLWKERNNRVFNNTPSNSSTLIEQVKLNLFL